MDFRIAIVVGKMTSLANIETIFNRVSKIAGGGSGEIMVKTRHGLIANNTIQELKSFLSPDKVWPDDFYNKLLIELYSAL